MADQESVADGEHTLDPKLLEILRCPISHEPLVHKGNQLLCYKSRKAYPIHDGIPVMLVEEASDIPESEIPPDQR